MPSTPVNWSLNIDADEPPTDADLRTIGALISGGLTSGTIQRYTVGRVTELVPLGPTSVGELNRNGQIGSGWQRRFARPGDRVDGRDVGGHDLARFHRLAIVTVYLIRGSFEPFSLWFEQHARYEIVDSLTDDDKLRDPVAAGEVVTRLRSATEDDSYDADTISRQLCAEIDPDTLDWTQPKVALPQDDVRKWLNINPGTLRHNRKDPRTIPGYKRAHWDADERAYVEHLEVQENAVSSVDPLPGDHDLVISVLAYIAHQQRALNAMQEIALSARQELANGMALEDCHAAEALRRVWAEILPRRPTERATRPPSARVSAGHCTQEGVPDAYRSPQPPRAPIADQGRSGPPNLPPDPIDDPLTPRRGPLS